MLPQPLPLYQTPEGIPSMSLQIAMLCEPKMTSHVKPTTPTTFGTGQPGPSGRRGNYFSCSKLGATGYSKSTFSFTTFQHLLPNPFALCSRSWGSPGPCRSCPERKTNSLTASICMTGFGVLFLFCFVFWKTSDCSTSSKIFQRKAKKQAEGCVRRRSLNSFAFFL